jgi:hypothetical protein
MSAALSLRPRRAAASAAAAAARAVTARSSSRWLPLGLPPLPGGDVRPST